MKGAFLSLSDQDRRGGCMSHVFWGTGSWESSPVVVSCHQQGLMLDLPRHPPRSGEGQRRWSKWRNIQDVGVIRVQLCSFVGFGEAVGSYSKYNGKWLSRSRKGSDIIGSHVYRLMCLLNGKWTRKKEGRGSQHNPYEVWWWPGLGRWQLERRDGDDREVLLRDQSQTGGFSMKTE